MRPNAIIMGLALVSSVGACGTAATRGGGGGGGGGASARVLAALPLGSDAVLPVPPANPLACGRVALGRRLFFDVRLSRQRATSCATCHDPKRAFTDGRVLPIGDGATAGTRNVPTLFGRAYGEFQFWDGRAGSLEEQALQPFTNPREFANSHEEVEHRLREDRAYRSAFASVFDGREPSAHLAALAIAGFVRTLVTGDAPVDRFMLNRDSTALTPEARRGFELFRFKAGCIRCHEPPLFSDERFHNTGVAWRDSAFADSGRLLVSGRPEDAGAFKTPTLRNTALTAPYMHDGSIASLEEVLEFYDRGGRPNPHLDPLFRPLNLTAPEKADLVAFLQALTGTHTLAHTERCPGPA